MKVDILLKNYFGMINALNNYNSIILEGEK